jgi:hypothetical protein
MKTLFNVCYKMDIGHGSVDVWRIFGFDDVCGTGKYISVPVNYDELSKIITTKSGSQYKIITFNQDENSFTKQIKHDIKNGKYEQY